MKAKILIGALFFMFLGVGGQKSRATGIDFHFENGWCTCKNMICQDANYFGFRKTCHFFGRDEHPTDDTCAPFSSNCIRTE